MKAHESILLDSIQQKVEQLIGLHKQSLEANRLLQTEVDTLRQQLTKYKTEKETLEKRVQKMQMAGTFLASSQDAKEAKLRISRLVREIDKCMALLNQ